MSLSTPLCASPVTVCELSPEPMDEDMHLDDASRVLFTREPVVVDRLLEQGRKYHAQQQARLQAAERERQRAEAAAQAERVAAREAHVKAYYAQHSAAELAAHRHARLARDVERQAALQEEAARQAPHQPTLTRHSIALAARRREKEGLPADLSPSEVQRRRREAAEEARQAAEEAYQRAHAPRGTPAISARAQALQFPLPAAERLYRHARELQHEASLAGIERQLREVTNIMKTSKPTISAKARALAPRTAPVHAQLYAQAEEKAEQREQLVRRYDNTHELFRPRLDPTSELLSRQLPHTAADRLYGETRQRRLVDPRDADATFQPQINRAPIHHSRRLSGEGSSVAARTHAWEQRRAARLRAQAAERDAAEAQRCTFRPAITGRAARYGREETGSVRGRSIAASVYADPVLSPSYRSWSASSSRSPSPSCGSHEEGGVQGSWQPSMRTRASTLSEPRSVVESACQSRSTTTSAAPVCDSTDELMRIAYEALAEADAVSLDIPLDQYYHY